MMVKICGITNREDALVAVEGGAGALGFNFYSGSPRYATPAQVQRILVVVPRSVLKVGLFVNEPPAQALQTAAEAGMDILQVHGNADEFPTGARIWKAVRVEPEFEIANLSGTNAEAFLLDTPSDRLHGGTGNTFDWKRARGSAAKVIVAGGLDEKNVRLAIEQAEPWGVDACSRLEASPGRKDHLKLIRFLKAALS